MLWRIACWLVAACLPACLWATTPDAMPLLQDGSFARGVQVVPPSRQHKAVHRQQAMSCLPLRDCSAVPVWQLQQWGSVLDIATAAQSADGWLLRDSAGRLQKRLQFADGHVLLEINGLAEFAARHDDGIAQYLPDLRRAWPHWLLSQQLTRVRLSDSNALQLSGEVRLLFDNAQRAAGYDPAVHAARFLLAMTVRNRLTGNYFWLTLPLYDDRFPRSDFGCQKCLDGGERCYTPQRLADLGIWRCPEDRVGASWWENEKSGTGKMIFRIPSEAFMRGDIHAGAWVAVAGDLRPYVLAGIDAVRQRDRTFPHDPFFYDIGLFSLGWEVTGFNHAAVELRGWQLNALR